MRRVVGFVVVIQAAVACAQHPEPKPEASTKIEGHSATADAGRAPEPVALPTATADASPPPVAAPVAVKVKIVTIGMHVAGGPFDEPTKEPFKKAVEPHFPEMAQCWGKHVPIHGAPKQADVGVDLLIEAGGGPPKVSNPRSTLPGGGPAVAAETAELVPCIVTVFESVQFPKLDRGRTGVSYSLRFVP